MGPLLLVGIGVMLLGCERRGLVVDTTAPAWPAIQQALEAGGPRVAVAVTTSAVALNNLCEGRADMAATDRTMTRAELIRCSNHGVCAMEYDLGETRVVLIVNQDNDWADSLTGTELRRLWAGTSEGRLARWSHLRTGWPDAPLRLITPGRSSAAFQALTRQLGPGQAPVRADVTHTPNPALLVHAVARDRYALGVTTTATLDAGARRVRTIGAEGFDAVLPLYLYANKERRDAVDAFLARTGARHGSTRLVRQSVMPEALAARRSGAP